MGSCKLYDYRHELQARASVGVSAYPTVLFLDEDSNFITGIPGYQTPSQLEVFLKLFGNNDYKTVKTQEEFQKYQSNFKHTFKGN